MTANKAANPFLLCVWVHPNPAGCLFTHRRNPNPTEHDTVTVGLDKSSQLAWEKKSDAGSLCFSDSTLKQNFTSWKELMNQKMFYLVRADNITQYCLTGLYIQWDSHWGNALKDTLMIGR